MGKSSGATGKSNELIGRTSLLCRLFLFIPRCLRSSILSSLPGLSELQSKANACIAALLVQ
ncbi:hypothetical protein C2E31_09050 [Rhodopirellula baltica]|nr:hypothetical protein C2E31_09050 [Rhodopirellula baltica]